MEYNIAKSGDTTIIKLEGQFTFSDAKKFKNILDILHNSSIKTLSFDFSDITFIDSACMGMLLLLREECLSRNIDLNLHSPQGQVEKIFEISKFDQLFSISRNN
jgi:HptB-dependent secretion and biofilm anti anti-sigma factor